MPNHDRALRPVRQMTESHIPRRLSMLEHSHLAVCISGAPADGLDQVGRRRLLLSALQELQPPSPGCAPCIMQRGLPVLLPDVSNNVPVGSPSDSAPRNSFAGVHTPVLPPVDYVLSAPRIIHEQLFRVPSAAAQNSTRKLTACAPDDPVIGSRQHSFQHRPPSVPEPRGNAWPCAQWSLARTTPS